MTVWARRPTSCGLPQCRQAIVTVSGGVAAGRDGRPDADPIALLLKSGNFGAADLFSTAWEVAP